MSQISKIFSCRQCGACCQGNTTVSLDEDDQKRMQEFLNLSMEEVQEKYLRITGNIVQMKTVDGHCIFYKEGCSVHDGKPWRCRQWPLHPAILRDELNWQAIVDSCPGLNRTLTYQEFCAVLQDVLDNTCVSR